MPDLKSCSVSRHERLAGLVGSTVARWIGTYAGPEYHAVVAEVLAVTDRTGAGLGPDEQARASGHFSATARYEWMFWDAAYRCEQWPL